MSQRLVLLDIEADELPQTDNALARGQLVFVEAEHLQGRVALESALRDLVLIKDELLEERVKEGRKLLSRPEAEIASPKIASSKAAKEALQTCTLAVLEEAPAL